MSRRVSLQGRGGWGASPGSRGGPVPGPAQEWGQGREPGVRMTPQPAPSQAPPPATSPAPDPDLPATIPGSGGDQGSADVRKVGGPAPPPPFPEKEENLDCISLAELA